MNSVGAGDKLARGMAKAQFPAAEPKTAQERWDAAFKDFDSKTFEMPKPAEGLKKETNKAH